MLVALRVLAVVAFTLVAVISAPWSSWAGSEIIFNNFGPGRTFSTTSSRSATTPPFGNPPGDYDLAAPFIIDHPTDVFLEEIDLALNQYAGPEAEVLLVDDGPLSRDGCTSPGSRILESFRTAGSSSPFSSKLRPRLTAGARYWLVLSVPQPASAVTWWSAPSELMPRPVCIAERANLGLWEVAFSSSGPGFAFSVSGTDAVSLLYATGLTTENRSALFLLDPATGDAVAVGESGTGFHIGSGGLAQAPGADFFYALGQNTLNPPPDSGTSTLFRVDRLTGAASPIGPTGPTTLLADGGLVYHPQLDALVATGQYNDGVHQYSALFRLDASAGRASLVGPAGPSLNVGAGGLAFDSARGRLVGTGNVSVSPGQYLFTIDGDTGQATEVASISVRALFDSGGLAYDDGADTLLASGVVCCAESGRFMSVLYRLDPVTGAGDEIGPTTAMLGFGGLAVYRERIPHNPDRIALGAAASAEIGTEQHVQASVSDHHASPLSGIIVRFVVTGAANAVGSCLTDNEGTCTYVYSGDVVGRDSLVAFVDMNGDERVDEQDVVAFFSTRWTEPGHDLALTRVRAPGRIVVRAAQPTKAFYVSVVMKNVGSHNEVVHAWSQLVSLVALRLNVNGECSTEYASLVKTSRRPPFTWKRGQTLTATFLVAVECSGSALIEYEASLDYAALSAQGEDDDPRNDWS